MSDQQPERSRGYYTGMNVLVILGALVLATLVGLLGYANAETAHKDDSKIVGFCYNMLYKTYTNVDESTLQHPPYYLVNCQRLQDTGVDSE